jgi:DNA topoisomerase-1
MPAATFDETTVDINAAQYLFRVKGSFPKFPGWMAVYNQPAAPSEESMAPGPDARTAEDDEESSVLAALAQGDTLTLRELTPEQKFSQPPPRYTEATLVKALERTASGRPSTYASIISVIQAREYVNKIEARFKPTVLGRMLVDRLLIPAFDDIPRRRVHEEPRRGSGQESRRHVRTTAKTPGELLQEVREGSEARLEGDEST